MSTINIRKTGGTWVVRSGGAVLGETTRALEVEEDGHAAAIYFPREDIATAFLDPSQKTTHCPVKGDATYYSIVNKSSVTENVVWSYENPTKAAAKIKGYLAFHTGETIKVEQI